MKNSNTDERHGYLNVKKTRTKTFLCILSIIIAFLSNTNIPHPYLSLFFEFSAPLSFSAMSGAQRNERIWDLIHVHNILEVCRSSRIPRAARQSKYKPGFFTC